MNDATTSAASRIVGPPTGPMLDVMGVRTEVKLTGADTGGRFSMFELTAGPGTSAFLPTGRPHAWFVAGDRATRMLVMTLPGTFDRFFAEMAGPVGQHRPMPELIAICRRCGIEFA